MHRYKALQRSVRHANLIYIESETRFWEELQDFKVLLQYFPFLYIGGAKIHIFSHTFSEA